MRDAVEEFVQVQQLPAGAICDLCVDTKCEVCFRTWGGGRWTGPLAVDNGTLESTGLEMLRGQKSNVKFQTGHSSSASALVSTVVINGTNSATSKPSRVVYWAVALWANEYKGWPSAST